MRSYFRPLLLACLAAASPGWTANAWGQNAAFATNNNEVAAIRRASSEYLSALRRGDLNAAREMWTPDGDYIDAAGQRFNMRELLMPRESMPLPASESAVAATDIAPTAKTFMRFVRPDVAIEDGIEGGAVMDSGSAAKLRFTTIWIKQGGRWRLGGLREALVALPSAKSQLQSLDWLLGEWVGVSDGSQFLVSGRWSEDGNYIIREFAELTGESESVSATQRIGWDAAAGQIKCWAFDSQGGVGEGIWRRDGNRWIVETTAVASDGTKSVTTAVYVRGDEGQFVWESAGAKFEGASAPPRRIEFKRAAEK